MKNPFSNIFSSFLSVDNQESFSWDKSGQCEISRINRPFKILFVFMVAAHNDFTI